jgi:hypothetical protein
VSGPVLGALAAAAAIAAAYWLGLQAGQAGEEALQGRERHLVAVSSAAAASAVAAGIAGMKVRHVTIRQESEREIQTRVEYRDCRHSAEQLQRINAALADGAASPPGAGELP